MQEVPGKNIDLKQLEEMFATISENTDWDVASEMLWGYFFIHNEPTQLEQAKTALMEKDYRFVSIGLSHKEEPTDPDCYCLHVEKVESHSPISLDKRNDELYLFAHEFGLDMYDGMDFSPPQD